MDTEPIKLRARALVEQIRNLKPDVVMLQEVTAVTLPILKSGLQLKITPQESSSLKVDVDERERTEKQKAQPNDTNHISKEVAHGNTGLSLRYDFHMGDGWDVELPYFPILLTKADLFKEKSAETTAARFLASRMHRGFICVSGILKESEQHVVFFTSHLESLKESTDIRKDQLLQIFDRQRNLVETGAITVFAGDTNLREAEVSAAEVVKTVAAEKKRQENGQAHAKKRRVAPKNKFVDAWLAAGADPDEKFTWDMTRNDNLQFQGDFKPKARYDRVFLLWPDLWDVQVPSLQLVGKDRLPSCGKFISDHWGICVDLVMRGS